MVIDFVALSWTLTILFNLILLKPKVNNFKSLVSTSLSLIESNAWLVSKSISSPSISKPSKFNSVSSNEIE